MIRLYFKIFALLIIFTSCLPIQAQQVAKIRGKVIDSRTFEPIPFANVFVSGTQKGTQTDLNGNYSLSVTSDVPFKIQVTFVGYLKLEKDAKPGSQAQINFRLKSEDYKLEEVTIKGKKEKYRNKDNPAVTLIRKVIEHKSENRKEAFDYYQYGKYEKLEFDLSNVQEKFRNRKSLKKFDFIFNYLDTSAVTGMVNLPMYLKETVGDMYFRKNPQATREVVKAEKQTDLGGFLGKQGISNYLESLYQDVNIYDNNILLLANSFLGPTSPLSPTFYRFVIIDTLKFKGTKCVNLSFAPRNPNDMLFQGTLYVALDSTYAIRKVEMGFSKDININFVKDLRIAQEYDRVQDAGLLLSKDELIIDFGILKRENGMGLYGQRTVSFRDYVINKPIADDKFKGIAKVLNLPGYDKNEKQNWDSLRFEPLSRKEYGIYEMVDSVKKAPAFQRLLNLATLVLTGWKKFTIFEIGPVNTFYSYNPIEGVRLRAGGRTTTEFSDKFLLEYYGAYGFNDQRFKYFAGVSYSLSDRSVYDFPLKMIQITAQQETRIPGQELQFVQEDNVLLSAKRGVNDKMTYNQTYQINWTNESLSGISFNIGVKYLKQERTGNLHFTPAGLDVNNPANDVQSFNTGEINAYLRIAPNEQYYVGKNFRVPIVNQYPKFTLSYQGGFNGFLGGQYDYHRLTATLKKRIYIPPIGFMDATLEGSKTFGKLPFPLLSIHRANQTFSYQPEAYNLMNFMEFISDQYAGVFLEHDFNGFFFNKIPLLQKLNWRELVTFKALVGGLSPENTPTVQNGLWQFPTDSQGNPLSFTLDNRPYMEVGFGVGNVAKLFRIYLVKRISYLEKPNIADGYNLRFRVKFDF